MIISIITIPEDKEELKEVGYAYTRYCKYIKNV